MRVILTKHLNIVSMMIPCLTLLVPPCSLGRDGPGSGVSDEALLEEISRAAFLYFIREADTESGLVRDKTGVEYSSVASVGFGLAALPVGAERGWIDRTEAEARALRSLRTLTRSSAHRQGVFCHFVDLHTGEATELGYESATSTIDTALLMAGVITAGQYFSGECEKLAEDLFARVNWRWYLNPENGQVYMAWQPEEPGRMNGPGHFKKPTWNWYTDETLLICLLGLASPNEQYRLPADCMDKWNRPKGRYRDGEEFIYTWPGTFFTYTFAHCYYDFRRMGKDAQGVDWFENTRRAAAANRDWCRDNATRFKSYGPDRWGITACGGPNNRYIVPGHQPRGAKGDEPADGTLAPYGAAMALPFLREDAMAALRHMRYLEIVGRPIWRDPEQGGYGLPDSFNIDRNWVSDRVIGIAHGSMLLMIENARTGLAWKLFMSNDRIRTGIKRAGFRHNEAANLAFYDGHVETWRKSKVWIPEHARQKPYQAGIRVVRRDIREKNGGGP
ncbi:MAG: glucoamylase family protein [Planctomycetota bacterium]